MGQWCCFRGDESLFVTNMVARTHTPMCGAFPATHACKGISASVYLTYNMYVVVVLGPVREVHTVHGILCVPACIISRLIRRFVGLLLSDKSACSIMLVDMCAGDSLCIVHVVRTMVGLRSLTTKCSADGATCTAQTTQYSLGSQ